MRVAVFGNSYWAAQLVKAFDGTSVDAQLFYIRREAQLKTWSLRTWLRETNLWSCDVLHVISWPVWWKLWIAARLKRRPVILHWIGSDVLALLVRRPWNRLAGPALDFLIPEHLAVTEGLVEELRSVGIHAACQPKPPVESFDRVEIPPLPEVPCALAHLPQNRFEFYGGPKVMEMARAAPDIHWLIVANGGAGLPELPNVEYLGYVNDMDEVYPRVTVLVRLTEHDGLANMALEAMARGRHVVWSGTMPHCRSADTAESALRELRGAIASQSLNTEGADYVRQQFNRRRIAGQLSGIYTRTADSL